MKKKNSKTINNSLIDLTASQEHLEEFERGIEYFNNGQYQHSFDAWNLLSESAEKLQQQFLRGLMDIAAGCQRLVSQQDINGAFVNFSKAVEKIGVEQYRPEFLYVPVDPLIEFIENFGQKREELGANGNRNLILKLIPKIQFRKPANPDLIIELNLIVQSKEFVEGVTNFNLGYYWESHEIWEDIKREQTGDGKNFIEAFVQLAEAYNFAKLSKISSAIYVFEKSIKTLMMYEKVDCKLDLSMVIKDAQTVLHDLRKLSIEGKSQYRFVRNPLIKITNN